MSLIRAIRQFLNRLPGLVAAVVATLLAVGGMSPAAATTVASPGDQQALTTFGHQGQSIQAGSTPGATPGALWRQGADAAFPASAPMAGDPEAKPRIALPVPAAIWMFGSGLGALGLARRRLGAWRRNKRPSVAVVRTARSIPPRHHAVRLALRERIRRAAVARIADEHEPACAPPRFADDAAGSSDAAADQTATTLLAQRFDELALALTEQPGVVLGRGFGMSCLKLGKRPFVALDQRAHEGIAFRVGEQSAVHLRDEMPQLDYWNPKQERQPKLSWLLCDTGNGEVLVHLAAAAYEQALKDATPVTEPDRCAAEAESA